MSKAEIAEIIPTEDINAMSMRGVIEALDGDFQVVSDRIRIRRSIDLPQFLEIVLSWNGWAIYFKETGVFLAGYAASKTLDGLYDRIRKKIELRKHRKISHLADEAARLLKPIGQVDGVRFGISIENKKYRIFLLSNSRVAEKIAAELSAFSGAAKRIHDAVAAGIEKSGQPMLDVSVSINEANDFVAKWSVYDSKKGTFENIEVGIARFPDTGFELGQRVVFRKDSRRNVETGRAGKRGTIKAVHLLSDQSTQYEVIIDEDDEARPASIEQLEEATKYDLSEIGEN